MSKNFLQIFESTLFLSKFVLTRILLCLTVRHCTVVGMKCMCWFCYTVCLKLLSSQEEFSGIVVESIRYCSRLRLEAIHTHFLLIRHIICWILQTFAIRRSLILALVTSLLSCLRDTFIHVNLIGCWSGNFMILENYSWFPITSWHFHRNYKSNLMLAWENFNLL